MHPKLTQAYQILGLNQEATPEELKKQYRNLAKKYHPDNKETGSEEKFKEIDAAYKLIQNQDQLETDNFSNIGNINDINEFIRNNFGGFGSPFHNATVNKSRPNPQINLTLTFEESILGCQKEITYLNHIRCSRCSGSRRILKHEICQTCKGKGQIKNNAGKNSVIIITCNKCFGTGKQTEECSVCQGYGTTEQEQTQTINIPPGASKEKNKIRIIDENCVISIVLNIIPDPDMQLIDNNVISKINLSLLECLTGCVKTIRTVKGNKDITIPAKSKNQDFIRLDNLGVQNTDGQHIVIMNMQYPEDKIEKIIELLKE